MDREIGLDVRRARRIRQGLWALATLVAGGSLLVFAADWLRPSLRRSALRTGFVTRGDLDATLSASGTAVPAAERVISSPVDGRVERVLRRPGDVVEEGTEILELDISATRLELERLEERIEQNRIERLQRGLELDGVVAGLKSRIETQRLDLEMARFGLRQKSALWKEGLISQEGLKEAEVAVDKAEITLRHLEAQIAAEKLLNEARLEALAVDAGILAKEREGARRQIRLATTAAPAAGVLTSVFDEEGAAVKRGDVLARVADLRAFRVECRVSDAYASRLEVGQEAWVLIEEIRLPGRVEAILPAVEEGTIRFDVALENPSHARLRQNLRADVLVVTGRRAGALMAPRGPYIQGGGSEHKVFLIEGDRAVRTAVTLGLAGRDSYEVTGGLEEGDEIIISDVREVIHATEIALR